MHASSLASRPGDSDGLDEQSSRLAPGTLVGGKFLVEAPLACGGMGVLYRGVHTVLAQPVVVKIVRPDLAENAEVITRFFTEARIAARLKNEHALQVFDVGRLEDGLPYMVLELLEGSDLFGVLSEHGKVPSTWAVDCILQICEGLAEAHALGIVHRDLKPENLFLSRHSDGSACLKVLDFGVSKDTTVGRGRSLTNPAHGIGSPNYMSPEQMCSPADVDERADVWSLGVVLYELLSGLNPFEAETTHEVCAKVLRQRPPLLKRQEPELPEGLCSVVQHCLQQDPDTRFANVVQLAYALERYGSAASRGAAQRVQRIYEATRRQEAHSLRPAANRGATAKPGVSAPPCAPGPMLPVRTGVHARGLATHGSASVDLLEETARFGGHSNASAAPSAPPLITELAPTSRRGRPSVAAMCVGALFAGLTATGAIATSQGFRLSEPHSLPMFGAEALAADANEGSTSHTVSDIALPIGVRIPSGSSESSIRASLELPGLTPAEANAPTLVPRTVLRRPAPRAWAPPALSEPSPKIESSSPNGPPEPSPSSVAPADADPSPILPEELAEPKAAAPSAGSGSNQPPATTPAAPEPDNDPGNPYISPYDP